jgi:hypothetical protein
LDEPLPLAVPDKHSGWSATLWGGITFLALFGIALAIFTALLRGKRDEVDPDQYIHIAHVIHKNAVTEGLRIGYPLYHYALALGLALSPEQGWPGARQAAIVVLALAIGVRGWLSFRELHGALSPWKAALACLLLAAAMALPNWWRTPADYPEQIDMDVWWVHFPSVFRGVVNPNVWHNPTTIFAAPFALLVFHQAFLYRETPGLQMAFSVGVSTAMCALAKPNYLLAFLPAFALVWLLDLRRSTLNCEISIGKAALHALAALGLPIATLVGQFIYTYGSGTRVLFAPFAVWSVFADPTSGDALYHIRPTVLAVRIPASILLGVAFPCAVALCFPQQLRNDWRTMFAWLVVAVAVAQYALLAEMPVDRFLSGNFFWALVPASYILFLESCRLLGGQPTGYRRLFCFAILVVQAASGMVCLTRALIDPHNAVLY